MASEVFGCGTWDLVPWQGIEHGHPTLGACSHSHWTTREVPNFIFFYRKSLYTDSFTKYIISLLNVLILKNWNVDLGFLGAIYSDNQLSKVVLCCCYLGSKLCPILCDPVDYSPPGSSVCGISPGKTTRVDCHFQLQGIFLTRGLTHICVSCTAGGFPPRWAISKSLWVAVTRAFSHSG